MEAGEDELGDDDDSSSIFLNPVHKIRTGRATCIRLPDGDYHTCFGMGCEHIALDRERQWVCNVSGLVVGVEHSRDSDPGWTGRSTGSANPDDTAGTPVGGWVRRRDMFNASVSAFRSAASISDAEIVAPPSRRADGRPVGERVSVKRGALCVDEAPSDAAGGAGGGKRQRSARRETWSRDALDKLAAEAVQVINKLLIVETPLPPPPPASAAAPPAPPTPRKADPRLQNLEFVRAVAVRKYARACAEGRQRLSLDVLHNVCAYANEFVRAQRRAAADEAAALRPAPSAPSFSSPVVGPKRYRGAGFSGQVRNLIARLVVSLWRAACHTPHMREHKRGNDSFRPFTAGVLYSFKRGVYLNDGTCVVPALESLAVHLPALRSPHSTSAAKQLQSSSHRGICSFHRSISSMEDMGAEDAAPVRRLFSDAARQAAFLRSLVHQSDVEASSAAAAAVRPR